MFEWLLIQQSLNNNLEKFHDIDSEENDKSLGYLFVKYCFFLVKILTVVVAVCLAYNCNSQDIIAAKILIPVFAFFFPIIYCLWYFIYRYLLDNPCYSE